MEFRKNKGQRKSCEKNDGANIQSNRWSNRQRKANWGKVKETLLDILNNDIGKMEITPKNHG